MKQKFLPTFPVPRYYNTTSDIIFLDIDECSTNTDGCDQECRNTVGSFECNCGNGYTLADNGKACLDINECTDGTHNCQQMCTNTNGGFMCNCNQGYLLNPDGRNCSGEPKTIFDKINGNVL